MVRLSLVLLTVLGLHTAAVAVTLPAKDSGNAFSSHGLAIYAGDAYLLTGDTLWSKSLADDSGFTVVAAGLRGTLPHAPSFDGGLAISPGGLAVAWMGFEGGAVTIDLNAADPAATVAALPDLDGPGDGQPDNFYSVAGGPDGSLYTMRADGTSFTEVYTFDTAGNAQSLGDVNPLHFSGSIAVRDDGVIFASTLVSNYPAAVADVFFYTYDPDASTPSWELLLEGDATGNTGLTFDAEGNLYFNTTSGIGVVRDGSSTIENLYGDILDPDTFDPINVGVRLEGLAYDAASNRLYFAERAGDGSFFLNSLAVPEPAAGLAMLSLVFLAARRSA